MTPTPYYQSADGKIKLYQGDDVISLMLEVLKEDDEGRASEQSEGGGVMNPPVVFGQQFGPDPNANRDDVVREARRKRDEFAYNPHWANGLTADEYDLLCEEGLRIAEQRAFGWPAP